MPALPLKCTGARPKAAATKSKQNGGNVPTLIAAATRIEAAGNKPKIIQEYIGRVNSKTQALSIARMSSPAGWVEPGQTPEFDEYTLVLGGMLRVEHKGGAIDVQAGQAVIAHAEIGRACVGKKGRLRWSLE